MCNKFYPFKLMFRWYIPTFLLTTGYNKKRRGAGIGGNMTMVFE